jgi:hypothetical protein
MGFDRTVTLHRPKALYRLLALAPLLGTAVGVAMVLAGRMPRSDLIPFVLDPAIFSTVFWYWAVRRNPSPMKVRGRLTVGADGVSVDGALALERRAIRRGYVQPWPGREPTVRLVGRGGAVLLEAEVADEAEGRELLDAVDLGVAQRATSFTATSPLYATVARRIGILLTAVTACLGGAAAGKVLGIDQAMAYLWIFVPVILTLVAAIPASIHVGADGVLLTWLWRRQYYAFSDIAGARVEDKSVRLWLHSGEAVDLPVVARSGIGRARVLDRMRLDALVARIQAALDGARSGRESTRPADVAALVARGGRTAEEWTRAVRALLAGASADYRSNAVPEENLWRVAEDPTAEETARVGAAVALRTRMDDDGRARMLRVAEATVSPKVRVALRAAASEEDEALVEALAAYDALSPAG